MRNILTSLTVICFLFRGCSPETGIPFEVNTENGTITYSGGSEPLGPISMRLNGNDALKNSFLFHEKDSLVCINSMDHTDIVYVFKGHPSSGSIKISLINAGKVNSEISEFQIVVFQKDPNLYDYLFTSNHATWDFSRDTKGDTLLFSLRNCGIPVILLPGEKLQLPRLNLINSLSGSDG